MSTGVERPRALERHGIETDRVRWNLSPAALYEEAVRRKEGEIAAGGPLACRTGQHTGRSPNDKFVVREPSSEAEIAWGKVNRPMEPAQFDLLHRDLVKSLTGKELFVLDCFAGADPTYRLPVRVINEFAWHNLFCRNLFIDDPAAAEAGAPQFTIIDSPSFKADPARHGTNSDVVIALDFAKKLVLIGGTSYAGEMKKSIFTVLNYVLPLRKVMPMHCSANVGADGDVALFFGLSGTGKTTLSSDPGPPAHRRRRARLERSRRVQLRGRLLREDDPALGGGRAADLRDHPAVRHGARERRRRSRHARAGSGRRSVHREHARGLSDFVHRQRRAVGPGRPPEERRHADRRRLRRAAADLASDAGSGDVSLPLRATPPRSPAPRRASPSRRPRSAPVSARRFLPLAPSRYARCSARASRKHGPASGW